PDEARLTQTRLADHGDGLPMAGRGAFEGLGELLQLAVPPDEAGQATCGARLKAGASRDAARQFVDRGGSLKPLHGDSAERLHLDMAFGEPQGVAGDQGPGLAICSIRAARWVVWPTAV